MTDCIRAALGLFEQRMVDKKDGPGFQRVYLDDVLSEDERMLRIEAIADPHTQTPEQIYIQKEQLIELYAALDKLTAREQTYLLYRYGFTDGIEHPLIGAALHFHLSESWTKKVEGEADGQPARKAAVVVLIRWEAAADGGFDIPLFRK